ncbi:MAG TPA: hypothetical protein VME20_04950 [Acidimicrobiales bacterium]|nr:hypothetical protein [Acidimicrobiales bacterium]
MRPSLLASTDAVAVGVTVVATLVVVALVGALLYTLRAVRELRREAEALAKQAAELLDELERAVREAGAEVDRVDRMVGSAEAINEAVSSASRLVGGAVAEPLIKFVAVLSGVSGVVRALRRRPERREIPAASRGPARRRESPRRLARRPHALDRGGR